MLNLKKITMAHGAGGTVMQELIDKYIIKYLGGSKAEVPLEALDDSAVIDGIILKSDNHTVKPLFFPGGDLGRLAVAGTVNDIVAVGGEPLALAAGFIVEEGLPIDDFEKIVLSIRETCDEAGVYVVTGDTKVMEKGSLDKFVVNLSGIGRRSKYLDSNIEEVKKFREFNSRWLLDSNLKPGDKIIVSGFIGDHGVALLSFREGYGFGSQLKSDVTPLNKLVESALKEGGVVSMKDPTRGGIANLLNEWAVKSNVSIRIYEEQLPIREGVRAACEMLGIDPLEVGNEGKMVIGVVSEKAEAVLSVIKKDKYGQNAHIIGEVLEGAPEVVLETEIGGKRIIPPPLGDPVPRIC
ncbi:MAG: hydrogenase expression/formation protein HypE [Candidatus Odinarchaeia archaeon]